MKPGGDWRELSKRKLLPQMSVLFPTKANSNCCRLLWWEDRGKERKDKYGEEGGIWAKCCLIHRIDQALLVSNGALYKMAYTVQNTKHRDCAFERDRNVKNGTEKETMRLDTTSPFDKLGKLGERYWWYQKGQLGKFHLAWPIERMHTQENEKDASCRGLHY